MPERNLQVVRDRGISPDEARADYWAARVEEMRRTLAPLLEEIERLHAAAQEAWDVLERLPSRS